MNRNTIHWFLRLSVVLIALSLYCPTLPAQSTGVAIKPPLGWNTWYGYLCKVTDSDVRAQADWMVQNGMKAVGYEYVNLDDCWQGKRDAQGIIHSNGNFPNMKALSDYIHSKGLKFGIYSSPGPKTCAGYEGSYGHENEDARTYAAWGVDFLKYDWCSAANVYKPDEIVAAYKKMGDALKQVGRPILYSLCQYGLEHVWTWGASVGANMWRTTGDLDYNYDRFSLVGFEQDGLERFAGPGHWNDPDMLLVGLGKITDDESRTQVGLWSLLAAPLIASADLRKISPESLAILSNPEVIAVDQDPAGVQGRRMAEEGPLDIWMKPLADGSKAVGLFNRGEDVAPITVYFKDAGVGESPRCETCGPEKIWACLKTASPTEVARARRGACFG